MASPTSRTLELLRERWAEAVDIVEHWNPFSKTKKDLFGFADILACLAGEIIAIQTTSLDNVSARRKKIYACDAASAWLKCGGKIWLVGWGKAVPNNREKRRAGTWYSKIELIELDQLAAKE